MNQRRNESIEITPRQKKKQWTFATKLFTFVFALFYLIVAIPGHITWVGNENVHLTATNVQFRKYRSIGFDHGFPFVHFQRVIVADGAKPEIEEIPLNTILKGAEIPAWERYHATSSSPLPLAKFQSNTNWSDITSLPSQPAWVQPSHWSHVGQVTKLNPTAAAINLALFMLTITAFGFFFDRWLRSKSHFFQIRLSEILFLVAVASIVLSIYGFATQYKKNADHIGRELNQMGIQTYSASATPVLLAKLIGREASYLYDRPARLVLGERNLVGMKRAQLEQLAGKINALHHVNTIRLDNPGDRLRTLLPLLDNYRELSIHRCNWSGADWKLLEEIPATQLTVIQCKIDQSFVLAISESNIESLTLDRSDVNGVDFLTLNASSVSQLITTNTRLSPRQITAIQRLRNQMGFDVTLSTR